jgi:hypothetical protein
VIADSLQILDHEIMTTAPLTPSVRAHAVAEVDMLTVLQRGTKSALPA